MDNSLNDNWQTIISSRNRIFSLDLRNVFQYKDLILLLVRRTFVARYKQTILGPAWAILQPLFTTVVFSIFFGNIAGLGAAGVPNFIFYLCGNIIWGLFAHCLTHSASTFISNSSILGKVYFPRLVMPISIVISQFISFFIQYGFMLLFIVYYMVIQAGVKPNLFVLMTPLMLFHVSLLGMGMGMTISALTTKYRDLTMVLGFGVSLWSYCSPVAYDMFSRTALKPGSAYYAYYMLNPMTPIINAFRYAYLGIGEIDWTYYAVSWGMTLMIVYLGMLMFNKVEKTFMDTI